MYTFAIAAIAGVAVASDNWMNHWGHDNHYGGHPSHGGHYGHNYYNPYSFHNDGHTHVDDGMAHGDHSHHDGSVQDHTHDHESENDHHHHDWADLQDAFLALKARSDALKEGKLLHDHFIVNGEDVHLDVTKTSMEIAGPWCIEEGETMELSFSATLEELADNTVGFALVKDNDAAVAVSRLSDNQGPSSLSLLYRETAAEDSTFSLHFMLETVLEPTYPEHNHHGYWGHYYRPRPVYPEYSIDAHNIQLGIKIFADGYTPVTSDTTGLEACESAAPELCPYETDDFSTDSCTPNQCTGVTLKGTNDACPIETFDD